MLCVDLGESFPTQIYLQNLASIQPTTNPVKLARSRTGAQVYGAVKRILAAGAHARRGAAAPLLGPLASPAARSGLGEDGEGEDNFRRVER